MGFDVAIVGATGLVGGEFLKVLEQRNFPLDSLSLYASDRSAGKKLSFAGRELEVAETTDASFDGVDIALFSAGADISRRFSPIAAKAGAVVIDNSSGFRMDPLVPLVVPEVNPNDIHAHKGIIANPNCSTIQMVVALNPLHQASPIKRILVSTYQAVSGTGSNAMEELHQQTAQMMEGKEDQITPQAYPHQIAFNALPFVEGFLDNDYTTEEWKMVQETRKILHDQEMPISATCVRVPVYIGHGEVVNVEFGQPMSSQEAKAILSKAPGIKVLDNPQKDLYPLPLESPGTDDVFVGRIRQDSSHPNGLVMWVVADNLRKGAALNAVQIAEVVVKEEVFSPSI
ncbi:MAG: aspartate-semialdehyde dehydrogenase, partial [Dehalococcoidia bacterium]|nr:aspartate-semialdehyde dehydrogenase [Dehalococcoidia bacterium]